MKFTTALVAILTATTTALVSAEPIFGKPPAPRSAALEARDMYDCDAPATYDCGRFGDGIWVCNAVNKWVLQASCGGRDCCNPDGRTCHC